MLFELCYIWYSVKCYRIYGYQQVIDNDHSYSAETTKYVVSSLKCFVYAQLRNTITQCSGLLAKKCQEFNSSTTLDLPFHLSNYDHYLVTMDTVTFHRVPYMAKFKQHIFIL